MKTLILTASPRAEGNTNSLVTEFMKELERQGEKPVRMNLYGMNLKPCRACRNCQASWDKPGCAIDDDMQQVFDAVLAADLIVLATPVYSWYCTPPMKAMLDRCVYAMNKYYGTPDAAEIKRGPAIWAGKHVALITTCGYEPEKGADLLEQGIRRYCKHSQLKYQGMLVERHMGYDTQFIDNAKADRAAQFARELLEKVKE